MNTRNFIRHIYIAVILSGICITSCDSDDAISADSLYYNIELSSDYLIPSKGIDPTSYGNGKKVIIRANGHWTIEPVGDDTGWMKIYPMEGDDDGWLRLYADENTRASERTAEYMISVNGIPQEETLNITQAPAQPFLNISTSALTFKRIGGELSVIVDTNVDWEYNIDGEDASRFVATSSDMASLTVKAIGVNETGADISAALILRGTGDNSSVNRVISLTQLYATFFDDFSWLKSEAGVLGWKIATGKKEVRIDQWSAEEKGHGWTSLSTWRYSRTGFIKFGKGGYGGDVASPYISEISGSADVTISWNALGYVTAKNVHDDIDYYFVGILGPGNITGTSSNGTSGATFIYKDSDGESVTLNAVRFELGAGAWFDPVNDPTGTEVWTSAASLFSINVEGFTSESRVVFVIGTGSVDNAYQNSNSKNSRLFVDNFKIVEN